MRGGTSLMLLGISRIECMSDILTLIIPEIKYMPDASDNSRNWIHVKTEPNK